MATQPGLTRHTSTSSVASSTTGTGQTQYSIRETIKIYTDWANHYLEKARSDRRVENLQKDLSDGVLLAYIVQAVTNKTLDGINYNPKNASQMLSNISSCVEFLRALGVNVEELTAKDIKDGNLKSLLGLFFNLSRFKQQQKQANQHMPSDQEMTSRIPGSGLRAPGSSHKKLSAPSSSVGKTTPVGATATRRSGLVPPGQRQSTGSSVSSRSSSPTSSTQPPASKLGFVSNGRTPIRRAGENSNSNNSLSAASGGSSWSAGPAAAKSQISSTSNNAQVTPPPPPPPAPQQQHSGMLDRIFKSKKGVTTPKSKPGDKPSTRVGTKKTSKSAQKEEVSNISKPPLSGIPRGGSLSSRSRTPSRENLAKCRIQPPGSVSKPSNRLSSDSGIHSPADHKTEARESGLVRNNSLPSSRVLSTKDSGLISRQSALRASTNSPITSKKEQRSLPKALSSYSKGDDTKSALTKTSKEKSTSDAASNVRLKIPPPLPSSLPPPSTTQTTVYNQLPGVSHYIKPNLVSKSSNGSTPQSKDDINQARKLQQQSSKVKVVETNTQTDTSALQKIAAKSENRKSPQKQLLSHKLVSSSSSQSNNSSLGADSGRCQPGSGGGVHILPGQKISQAKITSLTSNSSKTSSGTDSSNSSLNRTNSSISSNDSVLYRPTGVDVTTTSSLPGGLSADGLPLLRVGKPENFDMEKADEGTADFQVEPMQPLDKLASYEFLQRLGRSGGCQQPSLFRGPLSRFGQMNRSFNTKSSTKNIHEDYHASDAETYGNGYLSDAGAPSRTGDYADYSGYISEGGASMYARRMQMQQRFKEGMELVQEALKSSKYPADVDDDSFDEDDASSVSSGDISDALDLVDTQDPENDHLSNQHSDTFFKGDLGCASTPYRHPQVHPPVTPDSMRNRNSGGRVPLSLARSSVGNGYMSDSGCNYSITEKCWAEQQRAKGLISSKTQQSLASSKQEDLYKYHTLGRNRNMSVHDSRSYALMSGTDQLPGGYAHPAAVFCGADGGSMPGRPLWPAIHGGLPDRRSLGSESGDSMAADGGCMMSGGRRSMSVSGTRSGHSHSHQHLQPPPHYATTSSHGSSTMQHHLMPGSVASSLYSHIHQGGYESDSGVVERRALCSQCCQPIGKENGGDMRGSQMSLTSTTSSTFSTAEERRASETQKLQRELDLAKEQVYTLTSQLTTNAHMVQAFEQSLGNMTMRLQQLQSKSEQKDGELCDMKSTIENLRRMTGLAHTEILQTSQQHGSGSLNLHVAATGTGQHQALERQMSADSINSMSSIGSGASSSVDGKRKIKKNWIRNSFSKAFGGKKKGLGGSGSMSDVEGDSVSHYSDMSGGSVTSAPTTPTHAPMARIGNSGFNIANCLYTDVADMSPEAIAEMKKMLREKEMKLTDIRLDALTSAHQLEQLRDAMGKMKQEMNYLKADNDRLHRIVGDDSMATSSPPIPHSSSIGSTSSAGGGSSVSGGMGLLSTSFSQAGSPTSSLCSPVHRSFGISTAAAEKSGLTFLSSHGLPESDSGKRVTVSVVSAESQQGIGCFIGSISVTGKTKWDVLDSLIKRTFKQYLARIDQSTNLGLTSESIHAFIVGEVYRTKDGDIPELLPYGYLVGDTTNIKIILKGADSNSVDSLAFETGIPKSITQRYASLLSEHKRIILSGPTGTGKSHLAQHLAGFLIARSGHPRLPHSVATFDGEHKSSKELRDYLCSIQDQCDNCDIDSLPTVIILDNLHHVSSLGDVFSGFLSHKSTKCPYIIGTMSQTTNATTNLQLHHNFRWVLCANHMEPVKGLLGRCLRRKLVASEVCDNTLNNDLGRIVEWIPKVWQHVNKFIESHNSTDATIGPRQFLDCPMEAIKSQVWFTELWNYSLVPYLKEAIKEGLQKYGQKAGWEDPADWLIQTYPWSLDTADLQHLRAEDVGYDKQIPPASTNAKQSNSTTCGKDPTTSSGRDVDPGDPLYNMILRLREASSYSNNANDSDSLESHSNAILDTA